MESACGRFLRMIGGVCVTLTSNRSPFEWNMSLGLLFDDCAVLNFLSETSKSKFSQICGRGNMFDNCRYWVRGGSLQSSLTTGDVSYEIVICPFTIDLTFWGSTSFKSLSGNR